MRLRMRSATVALIVVLGTGLPCVGAGAEKESNDSDNAAGGSPSPDLVMLNFALGLLDRARTDESFRDACVEDLDACLSAAGKAAPGDAAMRYAWSADAGHAVTYDNSLGGQTTVRVTAEGAVETSLEGGFASRATQEEFDEGLSCCWTGDPPGGTIYGDCYPNNACGLGQEKCYSKHFKSAGVSDGWVPCAW